MAGEWIKFEKATIDKPEVLQMAELLGTSEDDVIGKLLRVWCWFDSQSRDGHAGNVTGVTLQKFIDRLVHSQGFAAAMAKAGWLTDSGLPHFERHNGETAKNRALARDRKSGERSKVSREGHADTVTREEKRREDIKATPSEPLTLEEAKIQGGPQTPAGILASVCLANGIKANAFHPLLVEWGREGITAERLKEAIAKAMQSKTGTIPVKYLDPILRDDSKTIDNSWLRDDDACVKFGQELGITPRGGEEFYAYRGRIKEELSKRSRGRVQ